MNAPARLQRSRAKGWRMPAGAVYVGRPSLWGNPWPINGDLQPWLAVALGFNGNADGRRRSAVAAFKAWIVGDPLPIPSEPVDRIAGGELEYTDGTVRRVTDIAVGLSLMMLGRAPIVVPPPPDLAPLRGRSLVCWCPLDQPCHADILLELANR